MGTTRSLPVGKNAGVAKQISLSLKSSNSRVFFYYYFSFFSGANPYITVNPYNLCHRFSRTVEPPASNIPKWKIQWCHACLTDKKVFYYSPDTSLLKNILHAICKLLCAKCCVVTKNLSYFLSSAANDLRQIQL